MLKKKPRFAAKRERKLHGFIFMKPVRKRKRKKKVEIKTGMLADLYQKQYELDQEVISDLGIVQPSVKLINIAFLCEVGEVLQACKKKWCWWKRTCTEPDRRELLEEIADALHFALSWEYNRKIENYPEDFESKQERTALFMKLAAETGVNYRWENLALAKQRNIETIAEVPGTLNKVTYVLSIADVLGYSFEEVYYAYLDKHQENYNRLDRGY
jgi:dimeric dUTPase (all-alpha-NTP-PPase superfamily)